MSLITNSVDIILRFRKHCLELYPDDIDVSNWQISSEHSDLRDMVVRESTRDNRFGISKDVQIKNEISGAGSRWVIPEVIASILPTPRRLKLALRHTYQVWHTLHGEVDFDDLLVANAVRFGAPGAFDFLSEYYIDIRALRDAKNFPESNPLKEILEVRWNSLTKDVDWNRTDAMQLIKFLFPVWESSSHVSAIQGVQTSYPTDYWLRLLRQELPRGETSDQEVLRNLKDWISGCGARRLSDHPLIDGLYENKRFCDIFEYFSAELPGTLLRDMASVLFERILRTNGRESNADLAPGFFSLWRLAICKPVEREDHDAWMEEEIKMALNESFRFANDLYYYWRLNDEQESHDKGYAETVRHSFVDAVKHNYGEDADGFTRILDSKFIWSCYHFSVLYSSPEEGGPGFGGNEWRWFADLLLQAAEINPEAIIPQLAVFVGKQVFHPLGTTKTYDSALANSLFGHAKTKLIDMLATPIDAAGVPEQYRDLIRFAQAATFEDLFGTD